MYDEVKYVKMMSLRDKDETRNTTKQEVGTSTKPTSSSSRQWQWSGFNNPRIVRVSRTFGGKDRHSKVCTIKGLRDRRIRLSVPTAVQLYDLQDRLGLNQPSKVIDWLLDNTKNDIDKLPPLPTMSGVFAPFHQATHSPRGYGGSQSSATPFLDVNLLSLRKEGIDINNALSVGVTEDHDQSLLGKVKYWDSSTLMRSKQNGVDGHHGGMGESNNSHISAQNLFPIARASTNTTSVNQNYNPMYNYYHHLEPSNLSLSQLGSHGLPSQNDHRCNRTSQQPSNSSLSLSSGSQLFHYPSMATPSLFPPNASYMSSHHQVEDVLRQLNRFHSYPNSSGLGVRSFPFTINHNQPHLHQNDDSNREKR